MLELGINALTTLADFIRTVQDQFDAVTANPDLQNPNLGSTLNVFSVIEGGRQVYSVPDKVVLKGNTRTVPEFSTDPSIQLFEAAIAKNNQDPDRAQLSLHLDQVLDPAKAATDNLLIQALKRAASGRNVQLRPLHWGLCTGLVYPPVSGYTSWWFTVRGLRKRPMRSMSISNWMSIWIPSGFLRTWLWTF